MAIGVQGGSLIPPDRLREIFVGQEDGSRKKKDRGVGEKGGTKHFSSTKEETREYQGKIEANKRSLTATLTNLTWVVKP